MKRIYLSLSLLLLVIIGSRAANFKFAFLTDIHITAGDSIPYNDLARSVNQINDTPGIEFAIVSGDITNIGDRQSMEVVKSLLDRLNVEYHIIPGNHETKWSESGVTDFARVFGSERFKFEHDGILFMGVNSGPIIRMADGHVAPQDIDWIKTELDKAGKEKPVIFITHYPLQPGDVDNWYDVTDAIRPYNIRLVMGGHYHKYMQLEYDGIPGILCRSNLRAKEKTGGYSLCEVTLDSIFIYEHKIGNVPTRKGAYSMTGMNYPKSNAGYPRPDYSVNKEFPQVSEQWLVRSGYEIFSSPAYWDKKVYVGDDSGAISCYSATDGRKLWSFKSDMRIIGTPAADKNVVVFGSADMNIYGLNASNGRLLWKINTEAPVLGAVTIRNGIAYIGGSDHKFRAIDIKSGTVVWSYDGVEGYIETKPLVYNNLVIFGAWDKNLYALDKKTGKEVWKWHEGKPGRFYSAAAVWPVAANGKVFIADPERVLTAIDASTGKTVWRTKESMVRETVGLSEDKRRIYSKTMNDSVVCYSATTDFPEKIWASNVGFGYEHAPSMPVEKEGVVFGSTKNGLMFGLDAHTGKVLWKHKVGNSLISTLVPLSKNKCLFTATGGEIGLLVIDYKINKHK